MSHRFTGLAFLAAVAVSPLLLNAAPVEKQQTNTPQQFAMKASAANQAEIDLSRIALERSSTPVVQKFARRMIADHSKIGGELFEIASKEKLNVAAGLDPEHQAIAEKLSKLSGADFDREYTQVMLKDHKNAIALFEQEAQFGQDPDLKAFAAKTLPILREHLKLAHEMAKKLNVQ